MKKTRFLLFLLICLSLISCKTAKHSDSVSIKGSIKISSNKVSENITEGSEINGYVFSKVDKKFLDGAIIEIDNKKYYTNKNGYFEFKVNPGKYKISATYFGHTSMSIVNVIVEEKHSLNIDFELGTEMIICR